jgi:hypothetical protein
MERAILNAIKASQTPHCDLLETKLNEATSTLKMDAVQAAVAEALIRWAIAQPKVQEEAGKQDAVVNWVDMGNRALNIISPAVAESKSVSLDGVEAAAVITLLDWAVKQPEIGQQGHIMDYVGIAQAIITSNKAVKASPEELAAIDAEKAAAGAGAAAPAPAAEPAKAPEAGAGAPAEEPTPEATEQAKYESLAEKLFIVKILKEKKTALTEKEKKFMAETEAIKLTDKERTIVMEKYDRISKGKVIKEGEHKTLMLRIGVAYEGVHDQEIKDAIESALTKAGIEVFDIAMDIQEAKKANEGVWTGRLGQISLQELFKARDAQKILEGLGLHDNELIQEIAAEIARRQKAGQ